MSDKNTSSDNYSSNNNDKTNKGKAQINVMGIIINDKPLAKLLVVDDDPDIVQVLKRGLSKIDF